MLLDAVTICTLRKNKYKCLGNETLMKKNRRELVEIIRILERNWAIDLERCENRYKILMEKEKYRWHDLKEHPEDVPDSKRFVEVRTEDSFPYYFGWYDTESEVGMWYDATGFSMNPYKWREIEEEVET